MAALSTGPEARPVFLIFAHGRSGSSELFRALAAAKATDSLAWEPLKARPGVRAPVTLEELETRLREIRQAHVKHLWTQVAPEINLAFDLPPVFRAIANWNFPPLIG